MTDTSGAAGSPADAAAAAEANRQAAAAAQAAADAAAGGDAAAQAAAQAAADAAAAGDGDSPWNDPAKAKAEIERLRRENGDARINAKKTAAEEAKAELLDTLTKALDPNAKKEDQLTAEQVTAKLEELGTANTGLAKERAVTAEAWKLGLNPAKADYLQFVLARNAEYEKLDPAAADFAAKLSAVISSEVAKDSSLKLSGAAQGTGAEQFGGAEGAQAMTKEQFANLSIAEQGKLFTSNRSEFDRLSAL